MGYNDHFTTMLIHAIPDELPEIMLPISRMTQVLKDLVA